MDSLKYGDYYADFFETNSTVHLQKLTGFGPGNHTIKISCRDIAGNTANSSVSFDIFYDKSEPKITRIYKTKTSIIINTDEPAECLYNFDNKTKGCDFGFENARGSYSMQHALQLNREGGIYFIKCIDEMGNKPLSGCSVVARVFGNEA